MKKFIGPVNESELLEVHRLAVEGGVLDVAADVGKLVSPIWLEQGRFLELDRLAGGTLSVGLDSFALTDKGLVAQAAGDLDTARRFYETAMTSDRASGNSQMLAADLANLASLDAIAGDYQLALDRYEEALALERRIDDKEGLAGTLHSIACIWIQLERDQHQIRALLLEALDQAQEIGSPLAEAVIRTTIAGYDPALGVVDRLGHLRAAIDLAEEVGNVGQQIVGHRIISDLLARNGREAEAQDHSAAAQRLEEPARGPDRLS